MSCKGNNKKVHNIYRFLKKCSEGGIGTFVFSYILFPHVVCKILYLKIGSAFYTEYLQKISLTFTISINC